MGSPRSSGSSAPQDGRTTRLHGPRPEILEGNDCDTHCLMVARLVNRSEVVELSQPLLRYHVGEWGSFEHQLSAVE